MAWIAKSGISYAIHFYNPNIHPEKEYCLRKDEQKKYCEKEGIPYLDDDYDTAHWFALSRGLENEPERGSRCTMCFRMRFMRTAKRAKSLGYKVIATTLGASRWKDMEQINAAGRLAAEHTQGVSFFDFNWRKAGGSSRMIDISKKEGFYQQQYCGCVYSLRDTNAWREKKGREKVAFGKDFYSED